MVQDSISDRIAAITKDLPPTVTLVAVSKYASAAAIRAAYAAGIRNFAESRVQAAQNKQQELQDLSDITWHMIGSLQSNKAKLAVQSFDWIHSLDRLSLARQLERLVPEVGKSPQLCLQVKLADDPHKSGWTESQLMLDLPALGECQHLNIVGLMTILPLGLSDDQAYETFLKTAALAEKLRSQGWENIQQLSMGMSNDYHLAIKAGATLIRVGSKIFNLASL